MKIRIEVDEQIDMEEVIIKCATLNDEILKIQQAIKDATSHALSFAFQKGETEYYLSLDEILFFETDGGNIQVHTQKDVYKTGYKLYELEELLPGHFMRVSKSAILNINQIYSITRNLSASSIVEFKDTYKTVFISRHYYKPLKEKLEEKRTMV